MSDPVRIGLVAEGPTDLIVIEAALLAILGLQRFRLTLLQPEMSAAFGPFGAGWGGICRWCRQSAARGGGRLSGDRLTLGLLDLLIIQIDADVADTSYPAGCLKPQHDELPLPCKCRCPPARATTDQLRAVLLSWCQEIATPPGVVLCTPSKSLEAWVVAALYPNDTAVTAECPFECLDHPELRLGLQPISQRIRKTPAAYRQCQERLVTAWPRIAGPGGLSEAARFQADILGSVMTRPGRPSLLNHE